jgi:hypothetical protein
MTADQSRKTVPLLLLLWLGLACIFGLGSRLEQASAPMIALIVWTLAAAALLLSWKVSSVKTWALSVAPRWLVLFHLTRFVGFYFLFLQRRGQMPFAFAVPAGWGDITVAFLAVFVLISSDARNWKPLLVWNCLGLLDILFVVSAALRIGLQDWPSMHALREWPLSLLPTFVVPLIIASHVLIFARARGSAKSRTD